MGRLRIPQMSHGYILSCDRRTLKILCVELPLTTEMKRVTLLFSNFNDTWEILKCTSYQGNTNLLYSIVESLFGFSHQCLNFTEISYQLLSVPGFAFVDIFELTPVVAMTNYHHDEAVGFFVLFILQDVILQSGHFL